MEAYCMKCKEKREMTNPSPTFTKAGAPATKGVCPVCGTSMFRMGATPAHDGLEKPEIEPKAKAAPKKKKGAAKKTSKSTKSAKSSRSKAKAYDGPRKGNLVIVESPAKARTVGRFLGRGYTVKASVGHVRDLYKSKLSVDVEEDFAPIYTVPRDKKKIVKELSDAAARAEQIYLATDPDREGEAIAWHVAEATGMEAERTQRVVFHEITQSAITEAFGHARGVNMELVDAQQARRIMDRLVGYQVSPLLWRNVRRGLSAGRVQSVALRLIVEREREIDKFVPVEYWSITAELAKREAERRSFKAKLLRIHGKDFTIATGEEAQTLVSDLEQAFWQVSNVKRGERTRRPSAPFTTSTLQQEASRRLGFNAGRTMRLAQDLYEGVNLGAEGATGLITYMRTDSTNISKEAQAEARTFIHETFGDEFMPKKAPVYRTRARSAQEAHEAIRPTSVLRTPDSVREYLNTEQHKLYVLIWQRFVASQMANALYDTLTIDVLAGPEKGTKPYLFRASGSAVRFLGFLAVYEEARSEDDTSEDDLGIDIPPLTVGELLDLLALSPQQHFTQPPPRYSEATLVKALEEYGIGRPSTYAAIISTILNRGYVQRQAKRLHPTDLGYVVNDMLVEHFDSLFNVDFTAHMEEDLDRVANGEEHWVDLMREFYDSFEKLVEAAGENMKPQRMEPEKLDEECPECGNGLVIRQGRFGAFVGCSNYPECKFTRPIVKDTGVACPIDDGRIVQKQSRKGRTFYGCDNWPKCDFVSWNEPIDMPCPRCGKSILTKAGKRAKCADSDCGFSMPLDEAEQEVAAHLEPA